MCEALPPTLEKNTMNLAGYMSICWYIVFWRVTSGRASNEGKPSKHSKTNKPSKQRKSCKQSIARYASVDNHIFLFVFLAKRVDAHFFPNIMTLGLRFVILGAPLWHPGVYFVTLGVYLGGFLWIWRMFGTLKC